MVICWPPSVAVEQRVEAAAVSHLWVGSRGDLITVQVAEKVATDIIVCVLQVKETCLQYKKVINKKNQLKDF